MTVLDPKQQITSRAGYYASASGSAVAVIFEPAPAAAIHRRAEIAGPDEDPNLEPAGYASPPCFMHELDPGYLGYLRPEELRDFLVRLQAGWQSGLAIPAASGGAMDDDEIAAALRAICREDIVIREKLRRQLERLGGAAASACAAPADAVASSPSALLRRRDALVAETRSLLPRIHDDGLRRDLAELVAAHERRAALTAVL